MEEEIGIEGEPRSGRVERVSMNKVRPYWNIRACLFRITMIVVLKKGKKRVHRSNFLGKHKKIGSTSHRFSYTLLG